MSSSGNIFSLECVKKVLQPIFVANDEPEKSDSLNRPVTLLDVTHEVLMQRIRKQLLERWESAPDSYCAEDVEKLCTNDWSVLRFLIDDCGDVNEKASDAIDACLRWRKEYGVRDMKVTSFPPEFYAIQLFELGMDADNGKTVLYIRANKYKKISELTQQFERFGTFFYEMLDCNLTNSQQRLTFFLDLKGVSMDSVDLPVFRHFLYLMFNVYPNMLQEAFVVDVSWILRPIVFLLLKVIPERFKKSVRFVSRSDLNELDSSSVPEQLGGSMVTRSLQAAQAGVSLEDFVQIHNIHESVVAKAKKLYKL